MSQPAPLPRPRALLWDNDGVLVDTERWYFQASRDVFATAGIDLTPELYFQYFLASSRGTSALVHAHGGDEPLAERLRQARNERYQHHLRTAEILIPGVREALARLRPHYAMAIVTSSRRDHFEMIHARTGLLSYFDFVLTESDYVHSKPAPDPYLAAVARAGVPAGQCLAIEDTPRGLQAASAASVPCWVVPTALTRAADFSAAARVLRSVSDVADALCPA